MSEEENVSVEETQGVATATESEVQEPAAPAPVKKGPEYNWAEANRKMEEMQRRNLELAQQLERMQKPVVKDEPDELDKLADDDIITKAQGKRLFAKMAKDIASDAIRQHSASTVEERIKNKYSDYDDVVTAENIALLKQKKPSVALSVAHNPDPFSQAEAVYDALKMMGLGQTEEHSVAKDKAMKNTQKPVSVNAVTKQSAIGNAHLFENGLTPELKQSLWKEMQQAAKRA